VGDSTHFWVSLLCLAGGGFLLATQPDLKDTVAPILGACVGFWFGGRATRNGNGTSV
jgi:hypothetical protein